MTKPVPGTAPMPGARPVTSDFFSSLKKPVDFYFIRHGQSKGNAEKILQGRGEYALSEQGCGQAVERGRFLKVLATAPGKTLFFSSPQCRAKETALIIADNAGFGEPVFLEDLMEMELGIWTGKTWDQIKADQQTLWQDFRARSWDAIPGAESSAALYIRALRVWGILRDTAAEQGADRMIAVTHGGLIQWLLKSSQNCQSWFPLFPVSNCGLFKLYAEPLPGQNSAFMCWEAINSTIPAKAAGSRGFSS